MSVKNHRVLSDNEFEKAFVEGLFSVVAFNHEAHFLLNWIHIGRYVLDRSLVEVPQKALALVKSA